MTGSTLRIREFEVCVGGNFPMLPRRKILQQHTKNHVKTQCLSYLSFPENSIFEVIVAIDGGAACRSGLVTADRICLYTCAYRAPWCTRDNEPRLVHT